MSVSPLSLGTGSAWVNNSVVFSAVGQYLTEMAPWSVQSHMKWCWMSMCLVDVWYWLFFEIAITDWLSQNSVVGWWSGLMISARKAHVQRAYFSVCVSEMYLASVVDKCQGLPLWTPHRNPLLFAQTKPSKYYIISQSSWPTSDFSWLDSNSEMSTQAAV